MNSCINGASEMVNVLAFSVIAILFNRILMKIGGSDGVASLTIILYAQELFGGLFRGYINGISSVVSYNLGRGDKERLSKLFCISIWTLGIAGIVVTVLSYLGRRCCSRFFCKKQRPGGDDRTVWIPDRGNQLPDDGLQRICIRLVHCIKRWKNICDLIFLPNCHFHDRAGTDTARDLWHGWSMDVHYSW